MTSLRSVFTKTAASPATSHAERPLNWRSPLGLFWRDIGEIGNVIGARRVQYLETRIERLENEIRRLAAKNARPTANS